MAVAAYACLVSLLNTMDQIKIHHLLPTYFDNQQNRFLCEKVDFLVDFLENYSDTDTCGEEEDLVRRIAVVAHEAEDIIEVHVARAAAAAAASTRYSRKLKKLATPPFSVFKFTQQTQIFFPNLQRIIDDMDSIKKQIFKIQQETATSSISPASSFSATAMVKNNSEVVALEADEIVHLQPADPSRLPDMQNKVIKSMEETRSINQQLTSSSSIAKTTNMVGFNGYLEQLLDQLTRHHSGGRQILPIVGMGGIGKTTLARNVYDNLLVVEYFYVRAWVTVSQEFSVSEVLLQALSCLGGSTSKNDRTDGLLGEELHKILYGRRYLIVLDDVWSVEAWDKMKSFFPENNNGSRIVITTRQTELVGYFGSSALAVHFLDDKHSWELFCEKTFAQEGCPPELEDVGHEIVRKCKGLPLAITVVGGLVRRSPRTQEYWEKIAKDKNMILDSGEGNTPWSTLYLSYKHLPIWLKSCFLYLGLFPEDHRIKVSQLIKLWVAEGFIKPNTDQTMEEVAENYLKELVDRNLVLDGGSGLNKKFKTCFVHDVVRDLCVKIGEKENFYCVRRDIKGKFHFIVDERTARFYDPESDTPSLFHPLILPGQRVERSNSRLLRVLFLDGIPLDPFREVNLRFLMYHSLHYGFKLFSSISLLWNLQTLTVTGFHGGLIAPYEIWKMPQLRHINIKKSIILPHPPPTHEVSILQNLQTLERVENLILTEEVCKRIPNIKKLVIHFNAQREETSSSSSYHLHNVGCLNKLESLQCCCYGYAYAGDLSGNLKLPSSLKKLTLRNCKLVWSDMTMIGSLPHLQILKLLDNAVVGEEWNCVKGEFRCLKYLQIIDCDDLTYWMADSSSFPVLETLSLKYLTKLEKIPSVIGDVPTLEIIHLFWCSKSVAFSAVKILEEQQSLGNLSLHLGIMFIDKFEAEELWEEIKELDITHQNLLICYR